MSQITTMTKLLLLPLLLLCGCNTEPPATAWVAAITNQHHAIMVRHGSNKFVLIQHGNSMNNYWSVYPVVEAAE